MGNMIISMSVIRPESFRERAAVVMGEFASEVLITDYLWENQAILVASSAAKGRVFREYIWQDVGLPAPFLFRFLFLGSNGEY
jgi:hypothetical protein